jgi:hypothetical protein
MSKKIFPRAQNLESPIRWGIPQRPSETKSPIEQELSRYSSRRHNFLHLTFDQRVHPCDSTFNPLLSVSLRLFCRLKDFAPGAGASRADH